MLVAVDFRLLFVCCCYAVFNLGHSSVSIVLFPALFLVVGFLDVFCWLLLFVYSFC
jgi:hypothetical protein